METTNAINTATSVKAADEVVAESKAFAKEMADDGKSWINAQNVAAMAATATGVVTMIGKRDFSVGAAVGAAAGVGVAYLGTKWIAESLRMSETGLGKAMGLFIGVDVGYALTNLGSRVQASSEENAVENYL